MMQNFSDLTLEELKTWCESQGEKSFHAKQIIEWVYERGVLDWKQMSNLKKELQKKLEESFLFPSLSLVKVTESDDLETFKFLWKLRISNLSNQC